MQIKSTLTFTKALARLEEIVQKLDSPDLQLEEGLQLLEEGVSLHRFCRAQLTQTEVKIKKLLKEDTSEQAEN